VLIRPLSQERHTGRRARLCAGLAAAIQVLAAAAAPAEGVRITGRLAAWNDEPLAGVEVSLRADAPAWERALAAWEGRTAAATLATTKTDAEGLFALDAPAPGFWEIVTRGAGVAASRRVIAESSAELGTWIPPRVRSIEVEAFGPGGRPVPGARVAAARSQWNDAIPEEDRRAITDASGRAQLLGPSQDVRVVAHAPGTAVAVERLRSTATKEPGEAPPPARVVVRLEPAPQRRLRLLEPDGSRARGALWLLSGVALAAADEQGSMLVPIGELPRELGRPEIWSATLASLVVGALASAPQDVPAAGTTALAIENGEPPALELELRLRAPAMISGVVRDATASAPIAGALVFHREHGQRAGDPKTVARADGTFVVSWPRHHLRNSLSARAGGYAEAHWFGQPSELDGRATGVALELAPGKSFEGVVVDPGGRPVAGAEISMGESSARSSGAGRFRLPPQDGMRASRITVVHPEFAVLTKELSVDELAGPEVRLVLGPGRGAVGWVVDSEDRPVSGAWAWLRAFGRGGGSMSTRFAGRTSAKTDAEGRFRFAQLASGAYTVMVERSGFAPAAVPGLRIEPGPGDAELGTIVLAPGHTLEGAALTKERAPIAGVHLTLYQAGGLPLWREATTGPDGRFSLPDLPAASDLRLAVEPPEGWLRPPNPPSLPPSLEVPRSEPLEIVLEPAVELSGRVEDRDGEPIAGATLRATRLDEPYPHSTGTNSNADGSFSIETLPAGVYEVSAEDSSFLPSSRRGIEVRQGLPNEPVVLVLDRGATLSGRVTHEAGEPVDDAYLRVHWENGSTERRTRTDEEGRYRAEGLPVGRVSVAPSFGRSQQPARDVVLEAGDNELDLVVRRPKLFVSGRVLDANGAPAHYARVTATANGRSVGSTPALDAEFSLPVEPDTELSLVATVGGQSASLPVVVQVAESSLDGIVLELQPGGTVRGRIVGLEVDRLAQTGIWAIPLPAVAFSGSPVQPDFDGRFLLADLAPGRWEIRASTGTLSGGRVLGRAEVVVEAGAEIEVTLDATEGDIVLSGIVTKAREPVAGASVQLSAMVGSGIGSDSPDGTFTSTAGTFELARLRPGRYGLTVSSGSALPYQQEITLDADRHLEIELPAATVTGTVVRRDTREPVPWANVSLRPVTSAANAASGVSTRSDARGAFRFDAVASGTYRVHGSDDRHGIGATEVSLADFDVELTIELEPEAGLVLLVSDPRGQPPPWVSVEARDVSNDLVVVPDGRRYQTSEGGRVEIRDVPAGRWRLRVHDDASLAELEVTVPSEPVAAQLVPGGYLEIAVPSLEESPGGERVELVRPDGRPHPGDDRRLVLRYGRARIGPLPPGTWSVRLRHGDVMLEVTARVEPAGVAQVELR
jgi:protocatechuate 3,4-dioxygenase beta subunit